ncbi:hypothetical protein RclHR1_03710003 [Rhizophagus clarus]|uniref:F-box domain-containing protein n=1 Tax=Rhizophagus clarus TaxID=94130 RepID=A0A2Z6S787_9GLOM|nr:hypothetical protein RclHR1_03710003 [Rhizophagus clarus]
MTCSKLFSGDLPELINEVIQYFRYDYKTLYSCILVNRLWCRLAIPLLWEDPFLYKVPKNHHIVEIILRNLDDDGKTKLNEYMIYNDSFPSNTLFNYPSFIQCLNTSKVIHTVLEWNEINLYSFEIILNYFGVKYFDEIFELILQNPNFISKIKNFKFDVFVLTKNITKFLEFLHFNCKSISSVYFRFLPRYHSNHNLTIEKRLSQIINSQENLRKVSFVKSYLSLYYPLSSLKHPNCSNTLNTIIFYMVDFNNITILDEVFNQLNVLESIHIICCDYLNSKFIQQINNISKPFKLKSLFLHSYYNYNIKSLKSLIKKFGDYLENFGIEGNSNKLLPSIIKYCSKINYLDRIWLDNQNTHLLFVLIKNITQNLNYLTIDIDDFHDDDYDKDHFSSIVLRNLGQILPFKLEYLHLRLIFNASDLEKFLKNSQNTFIKKLLIYNFIKNNQNENIFPYMEEYIMKKKRVKYLAILEFFNGNSNDLFYLKDKVKEFQLYDIQILDYYSLIIHNYNYVVETY